MAPSVQFPSPLTLLLLLHVLLLVLPPPPPVAAQSSCAAQTFSKNRLYALCSSHPVLGSTLHWTLDSAGSTLRLAFSATPDRPGGWVSWGINPARALMIGTQALLAFRAANGSVDVATYNVSSYVVVKSGISYEVADLEAEYASDGRITIFATMALPAGTRTVNQVWQLGPSVTGGVPDKHAFEGANMAAVGTLDLVAGGSSSSSDAVSRLRKRNTHGVLNAVSWGILLPVGALIARYLKMLADPAWFYLHVLCQLSGYVVGVAGWGTGLNLGSQSEGVQYSTHRSIGIALFSLGTLQIFALFLRPKPEHKYRFYWNTYHHSVGYVVITLGIINVFKGFSILKPLEKWKTAYIIVIAVLGAIAVLLEVVTWIAYLRRKSADKKTNSSNAANGHLRGETHPI